MTSDNAFARDYDFDDPDGVRNAQLRDIQVQTSYIRNVLQRLLKAPITIHETAETTCVVLFERVAYLSTAGLLSTATHDRGVLKDYEGEFSSAIESLPVSHTAAAIRSMAKISIGATVVEYLASWRGEPVDLRHEPTHAWSLTRAGIPDTIEADIADAVAAVPHATWRAISRKLHRALGRDDWIANLTNWVLIREPDPLDGYNRLLQWACASSDFESGTSRALIANAVSTVMALGGSSDSIHDAAHWFRTWAKSMGINKKGWRLLLDSPLGYWKEVMRTGYDPDGLLVALWIGQALQPSRLADPRLVELVRDIQFQHDLGPSLQSVPPQIWRRTDARFTTRRRSRSAVASEIGDILPWAASIGSGMSKTLRTASWNKLRRLAVDRVLVEAATMLEPHEQIGTPRRFESDGMLAIQLLGLRKVRLIATLMRNCLESLWQDINAGQTLVYFATRGSNARAVISLVRTVDAAHWRIDDVKGPENASPEPGFLLFASQLCEVCNAGLGASQDCVISNATKSGRQTRPDGIRGDLHCLDA